MLLQLVVGDLKGLAMEMVTVMEMAQGVVMARAAVKKNTKEIFAWNAPMATTTLTKMRPILFVQVGFDCFLKWSGGSLSLRNI